MDENDIEVIVLVPATLDKGFEQDVKGSDFDHAAVKPWGLVISYKDETWGIPWHRVHAFR